MEKGRVHIYTGDGKGKTTAAIGLCVRALGSGLRVAFLQFLKMGNSAEVVSLQKLGAQTESTQTQKFIWDMNEEEAAECRQKHEELLKKAYDISEKVDLMVLDEVFAALSTNMLKEEQILEFIDKKPKGMELVLTGRDVPASVSEKADYLTDMKCVKHPFTEGVAAREGIEY